MTWQSWSVSGTIKHLITIYLKQFAQL